MDLLFLDVAGFVVPLIFYRVLYVIGGGCENGFKNFNHSSILFLKANAKCTRLRFESGI